MGLRLKAIKGIEEWSNSQFPNKKLRELGDKAYKELQSGGYPNQKNEDWKYTSTKNLVNLKAQKPKNLDLRYSSDLSGEIHLSAHALVIAEDLREICVARNLSEDNFHEYYPEDNSKRRNFSEDYTHATARSSHEISFLNSTQGKQEKIRILLSHDPDQDLLQDKIIHSHLYFLRFSSNCDYAIQFEVDPNADQTIFDHLRIRVEAHSSLEWVNFFHGAKGSSYLRHCFFIAEKSKLNHFNAFSNSKFLRYDLDVRLEEKNAECSLDGLYLSRDANHIDYHSLIHHRASETKSSQLYKGAAFDESKSIFNGRIVVEESCEAIEAHQLNRNLLLSSEAEIYTKPQLEIASPDVSCTHGATIGAFGPELLFYLESRGISKKRSQELLLRGFAKESVKNLSKETRDSLLPLIDEWLESKNESVL